MSKDNTDRSRRLDATLNTVTEEAKATHGDAANKKVTASGSLDVSVSENGATTNSGVKASVTLETSESTDPASK